jgi:hypothetical protein
MEKVPGVQLFKIWDEMGESKRVSIIKRLTQWENELAAIQFPAYGNLYYRSCLREAEVFPLDSAFDPRGEFAIGPSCDPAWVIQPGQQLPPDISCGPCMFTTRLPCLPGHLSFYNRGIAFGYG